jgi:hypothetical protein
MSVAEDSSCSPTTSTTTSANTTPRPSMTAQSMSRLLQGTGCTATLGEGSSSSRSITESECSMCFPGTPSRSAQGCGQG